MAMYIKLTRLDNSPIWINAAFVVTVEPRRGGGSIVVPIGDGLDYDVRETTDQVLAMLCDAPAPAVVPVPAPKLLAPMPADVSPEPEPAREAGALAEKSEESAKPAKRAMRRTKKSDDGDGETKPAKRAMRRTKKAAEEKPAEAEPVDEPPAAEPVAAKPPVVIPESQVERLRKMMPGSLRKLLNTLVTQFKTTDAEAVVAALQARGVIEVEREHVIWK